MYEMGDNQAAGLQRLSRPKPVKVIAVTSGKGGVGKTNVSVNLAISLAEMGREVAILDADMGLANVDVLLGLHPEFNLSHVLTGEKSLRDIMVTGPSGMKVVPASSGIQKMSELGTMEQAGIINAFSEVGDDLDVLIVDTAAGISGSVVNFARACQEILLVVCDEPTSLTDAYAFIKLLNRDYGVYRFNIVTNMVNDARQGRELFEKLLKVTDRYLDVAISYAGAIPRDENLRKAVRKQQAVTKAFPGCSASQSFRSLARKIDGWPDATAAGGQLQFFLERLIEFSQAGEAHG